MDESPDIRNQDDDLDAFFKAAEVDEPGAMRRAAKKMTGGADYPEPPDAPPEDNPDAESRKRPGENTAVINSLALAVAATNEPPRQEEEDVVYLDDEIDEDDEVDEMLRHDDLDGKFIAIDPDALPGADGRKRDGQVLVLIPAGIHQYLPWWGWLTIIFGLMVLVAGVVMLPAVSLNRLVSRLGDKNEANVRQAMRQIVITGDERTVKRLYGMANSNRESISTRLRAVDAMSLIERVPEVDRALLRLELSADTNKQVREAAIVARRQREAYKTRGQQ